MPTPLKYVKDPKAKDPTARARMKMMRLRKAGHFFEGNCPACAEELRKASVNDPRPHSCFYVNENDTTAEAKRMQESCARSRAIERKCLGPDLLDEFNQMAGGNVTLAAGGTDYDPICEIANNRLSASGSTDYYSVEKRSTAGISDLFCLRNVRQNTVD
jgi:hypothetical protein